ncbi:MAG: prolipoprotein diacylglyceryl transferase [Anaerolineales bacterium]|nr:prolipoprotein diacylglyceryl transferase [Anaerolineales bacterium]
MTIDQFGIHIGDLLYLRFYGIILVTGAFLGGYLASLEARRRGQNPDLVWDAILWALIGGIIGARIWHILTPPPSMIALGMTTEWYLTHPLVITDRGVEGALAVWNGGLGIPGAVAGGLLGLYLFTRRARLKFAEWADIAAPGLALGQAIGRWGNLINQEVYGAPTTLPWAISIDAPYRVPGFTDPVLKFHPLFLYESIGNLLICLALLYLGRRYASRLKAGDLMLIYLILYPVLRFLLEFIRLDSSELFSFNANQTLMAVLAIVVMVVLSNRHRPVRRHQLKARSAE